ncbi:MAG: winged helix-turn-helix domain-containing protein [Thaumarchaeota archaeon]|nr:winged helix-turn-helix domain-containing protein [Nitrososphaerota archaeon]
MINGQRRRDSSEIMFAILRSVQTGRRKTKVMYEANLNLKQLNTYLDMLASNQMVVFQPAGRIFQATERGKAFVKAYEHYKETTELLREQQSALGVFFTKQTSEPVSPRTW